MSETARQRQKARTRQHLLDVALAEFEAHGYEATTIRSISRAAGVGTGTVFVHFENKADLLQAALHEELAQISSSAVDSLPQAELSHQLHHLVAHFLGAFARRPDLYVTLLRESLITSGAWAGRFRQQVEGLGGVVVGLFEQARERAELSPDASSQTATLAFFSFYYFLLIQAANDRFQDLETPLRRLDLLVEQLLAGLRPDGHTP